MYGLVGCLTTSSSKKVVSSCKLLFLMLFVKNFTLFLSFLEYPFLPGYPGGGGQGR